MKEVAIIIIIQKGREVFSPFWMTNDDL